MPRIIHFEINADEPERALRFYTDVFGWKIEKWDAPEDYWLIKTGPDDEPGINGGLLKRMEPAATTINTVSVPSIDAVMAKIGDHGGKVITPKMTIPGMGYHAYCQDLEGNTFGIIEEDEAAK